MLKKFSKPQNESKGHCSLYMYNVCGILTNYVTADLKGMYYAVNT